MGQHLKNIITGESIRQGEIDYDWQEFVNMRRDRLEEKLYIEKISDEHIKLDDKLSEFLKLVGNNHLAESIHDAAFAKERSASYVYFSSGFKEGLKIALMLSEL